MIPESFLLPLKRRRTLFILAAAATIVITLFTSHVFLRSLYSESQMPIVAHDKNEKPHPVGTLTQKAESELHGMLAKRTHNVQDAAREYRRRRNRHPPPGFDKWFKYAQERDAIMVEDFFDQIYHDLNPFWAVEPRRLRQLAAGYQHMITNRGGNATIWSDHESPRMNNFIDMVKSIAEHLPDFNMAINHMDESRIAAPWEKIDEAIRIETDSRHQPPPAEVLAEYPIYNDEEGEGEEVPQPEWIKGGPYWDMVSEACPPTSPARELPSQEDFNEPPEFRSGYPGNTLDGYVQNWTMAKDPCLQPDLVGLHAAFIEPISKSTTHELFPMFGECKLPLNNEILIPAAMYWAKESDYAETDAHGPIWEKKSDQVVWRGVASGGRNRDVNWKHFHRHRFVAMMNSTAVLLAERAEEGTARNFKIPGYREYNLKAPRNGFLGDWLARLSDVGFTHLLCFPDQGLDCEYTNPYYSLVNPIPMKEQFKSKYLPDIDGNSFSGRYRVFLLSTSLPIKATIYSEWHDSRLIPWVHFVPMDNTFADIYGIMDYFMGFDGYGAHDEEAKKIALEGKDWAEKVLRPEDMQIYVYRLLLEYARICADERERMGFALDLLEDGILGQ